MPYAIANVRLKLNKNFNSPIRRIKFFFYFDRTSSIMYVRHLCKIKLSDQNKNLKPKKFNFDETRYSYLGSPLYLVMPLYRVPH